MRSNRIRVGPKSNERVFVEHRKDAQRCGEAADVKDGGRHRSDASISHGTPSVVANHQKV